MAGAAPSGFRIAVSSLPVAPSVRAVRPLPISLRAAHEVLMRCLGLPLPFVRPQKLEAAGFGTRGDLENIGPVDRARGARPARLRR